MYIVPLLFIFHRMMLILSVSSLLTWDVGLLKIGTSCQSLREARSRGAHRIPLPGRCGLCALVRQKGLLCRVKTSDDPGGSLTRKTSTPPAALVMPALPHLPGSWDFSLVGGEALGGNPGGGAFPAYRPLPRPRFILSRGCKGKIWTSETNAVPLTRAFHRPPPPHLKQMAGPGHLQGGSPPPPARSSPNAGHSVGSHKVT